ncbi:Protein phosphatase methylesterase 1, partial [Dissostichus eleginoides]
SKNEKQNAGVIASSTPNFSQFKVFPSSIEYLINSREIKRRCSVAVPSLILSGANMSEINLSTLTRSKQYVLNKSSDRPRVCVAMRV